MMMMMMIIIIIIKLFVGLDSFFLVSISLMPEIFYSIYYTVVFL